MSLAAHKDQSIILNGLAILTDLNDLTKSLVYAALLTDDGFEIVSFPEMTGDGSRMASMASSMQALSDAVARELKLGSSEYIIIAAPSGYVIQLRVPGQSIVMSTVFNDSETLGKALSISRQQASRLSALMAA